MCIRDRGQAHQAAHFEARERKDGFGKGGQIVLVDAGLLRLVAAVSYTHLLAVSPVQGAGLSVEEPRRQRDAVQLDPLFEHGGGQRRERQVGNTKIRRAGTGIGASIPGQHVHPVVRAPG